MDCVPASHAIVFNHIEGGTENLRVKIMEDHCAAQYLCLRERLCLGAPPHSVEQELLNHLNTGVEFNFASSGGSQNTH